MSQCKACYSDEQKKWRERNPERIKAYSAKQAPRKKIYMEAWRQLNADSLSKLSTEYSRRRRERLTDSYVAQTMGIKLQTSIHTLIELQRVHLQIKRQLRGG